MLPWQEINGPSIVDLPENLVKVVAVPPERVGVVVEAVDAAEVRVEDVAASLWDDKQFKNLSTSSLTIPSFQGDPQFFHKGIFLKQAPHIK